ncbi:ribokinase [Lachnoclostridium phytofermentans]|uniref:Ribokinase n=1 Tax=Lachnoclostridium phytofermentans (strain ATCC 700394 / DSM 18823 / ISDg) TaxID=357809 RepID=A9KSX6_LACP7|nr:ribokinase [Lachnoclostridium phytofermentans]ABX42187.1 PfkB domain protein [Lachnoclostridium phytofermentans ISDg]
MKKLIVLGSLNMDLSIQSDYMPRSGETINGYGFLMNSGGKGGNQAVSAAKLGVDVKMIANVGNDIFGKQLLDDLNSYGVDVSSVEVSNNVSSGVAMITRCNNDNRIILSNGANHTLDFETVKEKLIKIANPGDIFLTQLENDFEVVKKSIKFAKELGLYTILNPAPAKVIEDDLYKHLDLVIVNQSECELLTGIYPEDEKSYHIALEVFRDKGVNAIITLGTDGSITNYTGDYEYIASRKVKTVDTTAAGDSYIGALCRFLIFEKDFIEGLTFASDVAALTVTKKGAQISIPNFNEVKEYFKEDRNYE